MYVAPEYKSTTDIWKSVTYSQKNTIVNFLHSSMYYILQICTCTCQMVWPIVGEIDFETDFEIIIQEVIFKLLKYLVYKIKSI